MEISSIQLSGRVGVAQGFSPTMFPYLLVLALGPVSPIGAQTAAQTAPGPASPAVRLTLNDAIARGHAASHRVGEFAARRDANQAVVQVARSGLFPQVSALGGYTRTNHVDPFGILQPTLRVASMIVNAG